MTTLSWLNEMKADWRAEWKEQEARRYSTLTVRLLEQKKYDDLEKAAKDSDFREEMYKKFGIE